MLNITSHLENSTIFFSFFKKKNYKNFFEPNWQHMLGSAPELYCFQSLLKYIILFDRHNNPEWEADQG